MECLTNIEENLELLERLGFYIQYEISVLIPTKIIVFLGFIINTIEMTISLTDKKKTNIIQLCNKILDSCNVTI